MPSKDENKDYSKISMRIGDVHVEFEGTSENIKKLMEKETVNLAKKMEATSKQVPSPSKPSTTSGSPSRKTGKPGKKGTNWRNLATAMMIVCIILLASVVGVIAFYLPAVDTLNSQMAEKDANIVALTENVTSLNAQVADLEAISTQYNNTITNYKYATDALNAQVAYYLSIAYMNESEYIVMSYDVTMNASESQQVYIGELNHAGYVGVSVESSSNTTYVQLSYAYKGKVNYDQNVTVAESGTAYFPVLPGALEIKVGNTDVYTGDSINGTVTAVYYY